MLLVLIVGRELLTVAAQEYPDAANAIAAWTRVAEAESWQSLRNVREGFPHADGVKLTDRTAITVFNIRGHKYRLLTMINYVRQIVSIEGLLTHAEYSKNRWKRR